MFYIIRIKILGQGDQARGKSFELLIVSLLNNLCYTDFKVNIRPAGTELDIEATHKTENTKLLCECKAHKEAIGPKDVKLFYSDLIYEIGKKYAENGKNLIVLIPKGVS